MVAGEWRDWHSPVRDGQGLLVPSRCPTSSPGLLVWQFESGQFYFNFSSLDEKSFSYYSYIYFLLPFIQVLYILSCCWISPDPDAVFICYLKMTLCYLQRHCLLADMRHQLSGKTWGWNISSTTKYPVPHKDVAFIVPLSPLGLFFCFPCHQGHDSKDNQIVMFFTI